MPFRPEKGPRPERLGSEEAEEEARERKEKIEALLEEESIADIKEAQKILDALEKAKKPKEREKLKDDLDKVMIENIREELENGPGGYREFSLKGFEEQLESMGFEKEGKTKALETIREIAGTKIQEIASSDLEAEEKYEVLRNFALRFGFGVNEDSPVHEMRAKFKEGSLLSDQARANCYRGKFAREAGMEIGGRINTFSPGTEALRAIAETEERDPHEVFAEQREYLIEMRTVRAEVGKAGAHFTLDREMEKVGFIWDEKAGEYRELKEKE